MVIRQQNIIIPEMTELVSKDITIVMTEEFHMFKKLEYVVEEIPKIYK